MDLSPLMTKPVGEPSMLPWCPSLPQEVCEGVIDHTAQFVHDSVHTTESSDVQYLYSSLTACALVCHAWVPRAQMHLYSDVHLTGHGILSFKYAIRRKPYLARFVQKLRILVRWGDTPISHLLATHRLPNLQYLSIERLDLQREHDAFFKFALSATAVRSLTLVEMKKCTGAQLRRLIASFRSLTDLSLSCGDLPDPINQHYHRHLYRPLHKSNTYLRSLTIPLELNANLLLDWFSNIQLQSLTLSWHHSVFPMSQMRSIFTGVPALLRSCSKSVEELTCRARLHYPLLINDFSSLGEWLKRLFFLKSSFISL